MTRPCPFCSSTNLEVCDNDRGNPTVWCKDCRCDGPEAFSNDQAIEKWNMRDPNQHLFEFEQKPLGINLDVKQVQK